MTTILKEMSIAQLCSQNEWTLLFDVFGGNKSFDKNYEPYMTD